MAKRLIKVAKELNVGTSTIVEFLNRNGFEIDDKPIAKVTDEMEASLKKEFQESASIKERADQLIIGTRPAPKVEATPAPVAVEPPAPVVVEPPVPVSVPTPDPTPTPVPEPVAEKITAPVVEKIPAVEAKVKPATPEVAKPVTKEVKEVKKPKESEEIVSNKPQLKVLGKIDLEPKKKKKAPSKSKAKETPPTIEEKVVEKKEEKPAAKEKKPVVVKEKPAAKKEKPVKKEEKPVNKKEEKPVNKKEKQAAKKEKPEVVAKEASKKVIEDKPATIAAKEKTVKSAPTKEKDTPNPTVTEETVTKDQLIRAEAPKLKGTKILGKIDVGQFQKKKSDNKAKPVASSDTSRARKRKRTRKKVESSNRPASSGGNRQGQGGGGGNRQGQGGGGGNRQGQGGGGNRQGQGGGGNRQGQGGGNRGGRSGGNNRNRPNSRGGRGGRGRRDEVKEVSAKEIEDKIKSTMARMEGGGKKRQRIRRDKRETMRKKEEAQELEKSDVKLQLTEFISVSELASLMEVPVTDVITTCMNLGVIVSINQRLDAEIIELLAEEFNHEIEFISAEEQVLEEEEIIDAPEDLKPRAPIVTVMGHVDHGKTSLLDYIRKANVADGEAGGITQHIGAYEVLVGEEKKKITFLDTPGHEAFTAMRARGAKVTDIAVIIIAADDSLMPQTKEAISHAQAAGVPIIFAINKIDKPGANPDRIKTELAAMNLQVEEWGGEYQSTDISAKMGQNIDALLEEILLKAEILELTANPDRGAVGVVLEASLDKGRGYVAKTLVQTGTLSIGDPMVAGSHSGKIKAMFNERGQRIKTAGPSSPVLVLGLSGAPQAGEKFRVTETEPEARLIASKREQITREQANRANKRISLDEIGRRLALGNFKELNLIVKGDVDGSIEALSDSLIKQSIESVQVNVIHKAVGQIIESDVLLASASDAIIIGFQVRPSLGARKLAEREGVQIKMYSIIYEAIDEIRSAIEGMLEPTKEEKVLGEVEVREVYKISKVGTIAGSYVLDGKITRNAHIRLVRNGIVIFPTKEGIHGEVSSLKRFKDDVKEVKSSFECGVTIKNYNDIKVGDIIEAYEIVEVKQTLQSIKKRSK